MKRAVILIAVFGVLAPFFHSGCTRMTPQELKASIEIADLESKWVSKLYQPWPPRLILVPQILVPD